MYLVFLHTHVKWELPAATRVFIVALVLHTLSADSAYELMKNAPPCPHHLHYMQTKERMQVGSKTEKTCKYFHLQSLFEYNLHHQYLYKSSTWAPQRTAMLVCSLLVKSRKRLAHEIFDTVPHIPALFKSPLIHCWAQNGSTHSCISMTWFFNSFKAFCVLRRGT